MTTSLILAVPDQAVARSLEDLIGDDSGMSVRAVVATSKALMAAVLDHEPDVVLLHEGLGPEPALTIARDLVGRLPWVSVILLSHEVSSELYASATDAGIRSLVALPPTLSDLAARASAAASWSRAVRMGSEVKIGPDDVGTVVAVTGSKGGVGVSTIATQLAFLAAADDRRVCLVDLNLYGSDLATFLGAPANRSMSNLLELSDELSPGVVNTVLYPHESGVRVLLAPTDAEDAELLNASLIRRTIAVLRTMFDAVVLDCGSQVNDDTLPAVEMADRVALVATADLLSLRAAHRLAETWDRLDVRRMDSVELVLNRVSRQLAVQPKLVGRTAAMPVCRASIPAAFAILESHANEGASGLGSNRTLAKPMIALAQHFGLRRPRTSRFAPLWRWRQADSGSTTKRGPSHKAAGPRPADREAGAITADMAAFAFLALFGLAMVLQLVLAGAATAILAFSTPRVALAVSDGVDIEEVQSRLRDGEGIAQHVVLTQSGEQVVVTVPVPSVVPGRWIATLRSDAQVLPR